MARAARKIAGAVLLLLVLLGALLLRSLNAPAVFRPEGVFPHDADSYYHLRRIVHGVQHFPEVLRFDPYIHYPEGAAPIWPAAFDAGVAAVLHLLGRESREEIERAAMWVPPALGLLGLLAVLAAARSLFGQGPAVGASVLVLAILGAHSSFTEVGALDHHAAFAVLTSAVLGCAAWVGRCLREHRSGILAALCLGGSLGLSVLVWTGSLVLFAVVELWVLVLLGAERRRALWLPGVLSHAAAALVLAAGASRSWWAEHHVLTLTTLSWLQPLVVAAAAAAYLAAAAICRRFPSARERRVLLGTGVVALGTLAIGAREALLPALQWVTKSEEFQASVVESRPLLTFAGSWWTGPAPRALGWMLFALPFFWAGAGWRALRHRDGSAALLFFSVLLLGALALLQLRFVDFLAAPAALLCGATFGAVWRRLERLPPWRAALSRAAFTLLFAAAFLPCLGWARARWPQALAWWRGEPPVLTAAELTQQELHRVSLWLRDHTPPPEAAGSGELQSAVYAFWDIGHFLLYYAERPVVVNNFGDDLGGEHFADSLRFLETGDEDTAVRIMERYRTRLLVTKNLIEEVQGAERIVGRLHRHDGGGMEDPGNSAWLPAVGRFRMLYECNVILPDSALSQRGVPSPFKVWELVAGARVVGRAAPGSEVVARLRLRTPRGRTFPYATRTVADEHGRFELRFPYATEGAERQVAALGPVQLTAGDQAYSVRVPERAVQAGLEVLVQP